LISLSYIFWSSVARSNFSPLGPGSHADARFAFGHKSGTQEKTGCNRMKIKESVWCPGGLNVQAPLKRSKLFIPRPAKSAKKAKPADSGHNFGTFGITKGTGARFRWRTIAVSVLTAVAIATVILWLAPPDPQICAREWSGVCLDDVWQIKGARKNRAARFQWRRFSQQYISLKRIEQ
jgi:hypothetical protein